MSKKLLDIILIICITYVLRWCWNKFSNTVINPNENVRYPNVKVKLVGKRLDKKDRIVDCAVEMMLQGYDDNEVKKFITKAYRTKTNKEFLDCCAKSFYIY